MTNTILFFISIFPFSLPASDIMDGKLCYGHHEIICFDFRKQDDEYIMSFVELGKPVKKTVSAKDYRASLEGITGFMNKNAVTAEEGCLRNVKFEVGKKDAIIACQDRWSEAVYKQFSDWVVKTRTLIVKGR